MTELRRSASRRAGSAHQRTGWHTFNPQSGDVSEAGFGAFAALDEHHVQPGGVIPAPALIASEVITYVREGALSFEDAHGRPGLLRAGEFQRTIAPGGFRREAVNASRIDSAHVFQMQLRSTGDVGETSPQQQRFSAAARRGALCVVVSPDGRRGSLSIHEDVVISTALLGRGQHVVHELAKGRKAWLHVISGEATLGDLVLAAGDGAGFADQRAVSMICGEDSEILLVDVSA